MATEVEALERIDVMVRRRMANTGESYETALREVNEIKNRMVFEMDRDRPPNWESEWGADIPWSASPQGRQWILSRPPVVRALLCRFPPSCIVETAPGHTHLIPAAGTRGVVIGFNTDGLVTVLAWPGSGHAAHCHPDSLRVVGHWKGWTSARVREVLGLS